MVFSPICYSKLKAGDVLEVGTPEGRIYVAPVQIVKNYATFVSGSGITPVLSILKSVLKSEPKSTLFGIRKQNTQDTIFHQQLRLTYNT
jgi:ring-1,2-phenylacetyl-CoA epoxidase subunit PaaE